MLTPSFTKHILWIAVQKYVSIMQGVLFFITAVSFYVKVWLYLHIIVLLDIFVETITAGFIVK